MDKYSTINRFNAMGKVRRKYNTEIRKNPKVFKTLEEKRQFRLSLFDKFANHAWYKKQWVKMKPKMIEWCKNWIADEKHLEYTGRYIDHYSNRIDWNAVIEELEINRSQMTAMWELISTIGTFVHGDEEGWTNRFTDEELQEWAQTEEGKEYFANH